MGRIWPALLVLVASLGVVSSSSVAGAAPVSTACDTLSDTEIHEDAVIGGSGVPSRFLADVDGDGNRDVVTGYWRGHQDPDLAEHYLHVELASGWGRR